jgi:hypothetical protein
VNITTGTDVSLTGVGNDRPNYVAGVPPLNGSWGPSLQYLNPAAFQAAAPGSYGNLGRDVFRLPGQLQFDVSLSRIFAVHESVKLEVRGEAFNIINHTNMGSVPTSGIGLSATESTGLSTSRSSATFGRFLSAGDPRLLQFAMKLYF